MQFTFLPASASPDARKLILIVALRGVANGFVTVLLASYLSSLGFSPFEIGVILTGTLLGSALLTLWAGLWGARWQRRRILIAASALMVLTGLGFAGFTEFWPLLLVAVAGTINPSASDVSVFLPVEQAILPQTVGPRERTAIFARVNLTGILAMAVGALASGLPIALAESQGWDARDLQRASFLAYAAVGLLIGLLYTSLSPGVEEDAERVRTGRMLERSRHVVLRLSALFSIDSFGGGLAVDSLIALWLFERFDYSPEVVGAIFFVAGLLAAFSQLASSWLASRIGLINTMVYTHLPANLFLILAAFMPIGELAVACLLLRMALSRMDVPARQSYVMAVVPPEERSAAASVTNVPRSLAPVATPLLAGALLSASDFGWHLVMAGSIKAIYDLLLFSQFRSLKPPEEDQLTAVTRPA